ESKRSRVSPLTDLHAMLPEGVASVLFPDGHCTLVSRPFGDHRPQTGPYPRCREGRADEGLRTGVMRTARRSSCFLSSPNVSYRPDMGLSSDCDELPCPDRRISQQSAKDGRDTLKAHPLHSALVTIVNRRARLPVPVRRWLLATVLLAASGLSACVQDQKAADAGDPGFPFGPTAIGVQTLSYVQDIKPILDRDCLSCHSTRNARGDYSVSTYA